MKGMAEPPYACTIESELVELARRGDNEACKEIRSRYHNRLCMTAMAMLNSHKKSRMAVEHIWDTAWKELHDFKGESLFLTWLCRRLISYIIKTFLQEENPPNEEADLS